LFNDSDITKNYSVIIDNDPNNTTQIEIISNEHDMEYTCSCEIKGIPFMEFVLKESESDFISPTL
jgi:hypothetical protein